MRTLGVTRGLTGRGQPCQATAASYSSRFSGSHCAISFCFEFIFYLYYLDAAFGSFVRRARVHVHIVPTQVPEVNRIQ